MHELVYLVMSEYESGSDNGEVSDIIGVRKTAKGANAAVADWKRSHGNGHRYPEGPLRMGHPSYSSGAGRMTEPKSILVVGDAVAGLSFYGPFDSERQAHEYAANHFKADTRYVAARLNAPFFMRGDKV